MTTPGAPGAGRGQPAFDQAAQEVIAAARGQRRPSPPPDWENPPGYERAELTPEERAEAQKAADDEREICKFCIGKHRYPTTMACPRIAEAEFSADGKTILRVRFFEGLRWAKGRVALFEDLHESEDEDGDGGN
jgi:hypothetical protein